MGIYLTVIPGLDGMYLICLCRSKHLLVLTIGAIGSRQEQICRGYLVSWDGMVPCICECAGVFS